MSFGHGVSERKRSASISTDIKNLDGNIGAVRKAYRAGSALSSIHRRSWTRSTNRAAGRRALRDKIAYDSGLDFSDMKG